jgi:uncharacterized protein (UPF0297 family)
MTTARDIRSWLMTQPRPTTIRLMLADGKVEELACAGQPWARLGESCAAMDPVTVFAVDAAGKLLRAAKVADILDELEQLDDDPSSSSSSSSTPCSSTPATMQRDETRGYLALMDKFGTLIAGAYEHATNVAFDKAFDRMVDVVNLLMQSTMAMQKEAMTARVEVRRMERDILEEAIEKADASGDGDMMRQFVGAYFSGQASRIAEQATSAVAGAGGPGVAKPNGKPPTQPKGAA